MKRIVNVRVATPENKSREIGVKISDSQFWVTQKNLWDIIDNTNKLYRLMLFAEITRILIYLKNVIF